MPGVIAVSSRAQMLTYFFFQAEDGIRDCLLSRGLGDVYKRQVQQYYRSREQDRVCLRVRYGEIRCTKLEVGSLDKWWNELRLDAQSSRCTSLIPG